MARAATKNSVPDTMMRAGSRATCSTRLGSRPRLTSVEAPSANNVWPTNAAMDFDAVALFTLGTPGGFVLSLLLAARLHSCPRLRSWTEHTRVPLPSAMAPTIAWRSVDLGPRTCAQIGEQRVHLIGFVADLTQVFKLEAQHHRTVWDQTQGSIGDEGFRVIRRQGKAVVRILQGEHILNALMVFQIITQSTLHAPVIGQLKAKRRHELLLHIEEPRDRIEGGIGVGQ